MKTYKELKESLEQLDELKKSTYANYIKAAQEDRETRLTGASFKSGKQGDSYNTADETKSDENRAKGIDRALKKLTKEEVEELDEIKLSTVGKIIKHSPKIASAAIGAAVAAHSTEAPKQPAKPSYSEFTKKVQKEEYITESHEYGDRMTWGEFGRHLSGKKLRDSYGAVSDSEKKHWAAANNEWELKSIHPETLKPTEHVADKSNPIIVTSDGDILDGRHRQMRAINKKLPSIAAWVGTDSPRDIQKEEVELDEVLDPSMGAGEYIKDFDEKYKDKPKEKRREMAIAAFLSAKRKNDK